MVSKYVQFGVNVFGIDSSLEPMEIAGKSIEMLKDFLFGRLELSSTFTEIGIDDKNFEIMAEKACGGGVLPAFKPLSSQDIKNIFQMCL